MTTLITLASHQVILIILLIRMAGLQVKISPTRMTRSLHTPLRSQMMTLRTRMRTRPKRAWGLAILLALLGLPSLLAAQVHVPIIVYTGLALHTVYPLAREPTNVTVLCTPAVNPPDIDLATMQVQEVPSGGLCARADVNADGCQDLLCNVDTPRLGMTCQTTTLTLTATLTDGTTITGTDHVTPQPCPQP